MQKDNNQTDGHIYAPWEKGFNKVLTPFEEFIHRETTSGMLLMLCAVIALVIANIGWYESYQHLLHSQVGFVFGDWSLQKSLHHWINDGLMALFFFVVGLEIKREVLVGELADPKQAALPIIAAIGGMVAPAAIYAMVTPAGAASNGWGIPMATDIAFAVGIMALLGSRIPKALLMFLVALAIVDDLGAVIVIALFYTEQLHMGALGFVALFFAILIAMNLGGIRKPLPYFIIGVLLWFAMLKSGVHATLAGVLTALAIPARPKFEPGRFSQHVKELIARFDSSYKPGESIMRNEEMRGVVHALECGAQKVETPLQRLEHSMHMPVAFLVIPLFALANSGIPIELSSMGQMLAEPVTLGVILGLIVGKLLGIAGLSWVAIKLGIARLPANTTFPMIIGAAFLGGIGFTMSIFIAELAFAGNTEMLLMAKTGILTASLLAGVAGILWLYYFTSPNRRPAA